MDINKEGLNLFDLFRAIMKAESMVPGKKLVDLTSVEIAERELMVCQDKGIDNRMKLLVLEKAELEQRAITWWCGVKDRYGIEEDNISYENGSIHELVKP